jgi:hypothetical protein
MTIMTRHRILFVLVAVAAGCSIGPTTTGERTETTAADIAVAASASSQGAAAVTPLPLRPAPRGALPSILNITDGPAGGSIAASQQSGVNQTDVVSIDQLGEINMVSAFEGGPWTEAGEFGPPFPAGARVAASQLFGLMETHAFAVDNNGELLDIPLSSGGLNVALPSGFMFPVGANIAVSQQFGVSPPRTDVFVVDSNGALTVTGFNPPVAGPGPIGWQTTQEITAQHLFPPGAPVAASQQFGLQQTDVFVVDNNGQLNVVWWASGFNNNNWQGPYAMPLPTGVQIPVLANIAVSQQFGVSPPQTDVFIVDTNGALTVSWVGADPWQTQEISAQQLFPSGAPLAASQQFGTPSPQTDVFVVDTSGNLDVMYVVSGGVWQGPGNPIGTGFPYEASIAVSQQFGTEQTDVFVINGSGYRTVSWVLQGNPWNGPLQIP